MDTITALIKDLSYTSQMPSADVTKLFSTSPSYGKQSTSDAVLEGEAAEGEDEVGDQEGVADII